MIKDGQDLHSAITRTLYNWWSSHEGVPARDAFDIADHLAVAPHIFLVRVNSRDSFEIRLNGEAVVEALGMSERGTVIHADDPARSLPEQHHQNQARHYRTIVDDKQPRVYRGDFTNLDRGHVQFESIDLPLINAEGQVTHIIGALDPMLIEAD